MFWDEKKTSKINPVSNFYSWVNNSKKKEKLKDIISSEESSDKEISDAKNKLKSMLDWWFYGRDKEKEIETCVKPEQFILLSQISCIRWRDKKSGSGIYSNEIISTKNEDLVVRAFKSDKPLFEGRYDKKTIESIGWYFAKWIIALEWWDINQYYLKKWALYQRNEDVAKIDTEIYKIKLSWIIKKDNGWLVDYVPTRVAWDKITESERAEALQAVEFLVDYRKDE